MWIRDAGAVKQSTSADAHTHFENRLVIQHPLKVHTHNRAQMNDAP